MRGFPFGTFSSFNSLSFGSMTGPSAEREAPHANSSVAIGICSMRVSLSTCGKTLLQSGGGAAQRIRKNEITHQNCAKAK